MPWVSLVDGILAIGMLFMAHTTDDPVWSTYLVAIASMDLSICLWTIV